jgi:hypothetical protein
MLYYPGLTRPIEGESAGERRGGGPAEGDQVAAGSGSARGKGRYE